ncbi:MAG: hypothetical protein L0L51_09650 [Lactococcus lactis]|nr:hypothetical protein [Lactococcus lactis]
MVSLQSFVKLLAVSCVCVVERLKVTVADRVVVAATVFIQHERYID